MGHSFPVEQLLEPLGKRRGSRGQQAVARHQFWKKIAKRERQLTGGELMDNRIGYR